MKKIGFLVLILLIAACKNETSVMLLKYPQKENLVKYAAFFELEKMNDYHVLKLIDPVSKKKTTYYLGTKKPESLPAGAVFMLTPQQKMVTLSSTHIGMLSKIDALDAIVGVSSIQYVDNPEIKSRFKKKQIGEFTELNHLNPERVLNTQATSVIYSGFEGKPPANEVKLAALNIQCIPNFDWCEIHPLGRAEWVLFFGALTGKLAQAQAYFDQVEKEYLATKTMATSYTKKPSILVGMMIGDSWYLPVGNSFFGTFFRDAGASYTLANTTGTASVPMSFEKVLNQFKTAEIWLGVDVAKKTEILRANANYRYFDAFQSGEMYTYAHRSNYYFENSASEPQKVLQDLVHILHPSADTTALHYYQKVHE